MTNNLNLYLEYIFKSFDGYVVGQGGFFTRSWNNDRNINQQFKTGVFDVLNCLIQNGELYFEGPADAIPFLKLGQSGYDYLQGGALELGRLSLTELIDLSSHTDQIYNRIWEFIGNGKTAPFYLKGSDYFNIIAPYVGLSSYSYSQFTQSLVNAGNSPSRVYWYRELFGKLKREDIENFLNDLSRKIIDTYQPLYRTQVETDDDLFADIETANNTYSAQSQHNTPSDTSSSANVVPKVIFITYTWETVTTPGHKEWVKALAENLLREGFDVRFDQFQPFGTEMNHFMATSVREADRILLICTPTFKQRQDDVQNAAGFEASLISNNLLKNIVSTKFLPIIRIGEPPECMPDYLGNRIGLIWRSGDNDEQKFSELIADLKQN